MISTKVSYDKTRKKQWKSSEVTSNRNKKKLMMKHKEINDMMEKPSFKKYKSQLR